MKCQWRNHERHSYRHAGRRAFAPSNTCALARRERAVADGRRGRFRRAGLQPGHKPTPANIFFSLYLGERVSRKAGTVEGSFKSVEFLVIFHAGSTIPEIAGQSNNKVSSGGLFTNAAAL